MSRAGPAENGQASGTPESDVQLEGEGQRRQARIRKARGVEAIGPSSRSCLAGLFSDDCSQSTVVNTV